MTAVAPLPSLRVRNLRFELGARIPRHWHGGGRAITLFFDNLSLLFPVGERFFIANVRAHTGSIKQPQLKLDVDAFCAQEGMHSREHARYNRRLADSGYPVALWERRLQARLGRIARAGSARWGLAITCALEHFTAVMGHILLSDARLLQAAEPEVAALWRWHAVEEAEHKAVAFEVYRAAGGGYFERVLAMAVTTVLFWCQLGLQQIRLMHLDGCLPKPREWTSLLKFLFLHPGGMHRLWFHWLGYYRPSFHPLDLDSRELLEAWVRELGGSAARSDGDAARSGGE